MMSASSHFVEVMPGPSSGVNVAKTGLWAEIQRERSRQQRLRDQEFRAFRQAEERAQRERARDQKAAARKAAADLRGAKRLYLDKCTAPVFSHHNKRRVPSSGGVRLMAALLLGVIRPPFVALMQQRTSVSRTGIWRGA